MMVNNEIENLNLFLQHSLRYLKSGGRLVVITFHSIEDSIVKHFFKKMQLTAFVLIHFLFAFVMKKPN